MGKKRLFRKHDYFLESAIPARTAFLFKKPIEEPKKETALEMIFRVRLALDDLEKTIRGLEP